MNPFFLNSSGSPSNSPTQSQSPGVAIGSGANSSIATANRGNGIFLSPVSAMAGTTALSVFLHNILTVAINSQEQSSRYLKAFRIYSTMRNDLSNQYQSQLWDPFVMICMIKVIYDTVLVLVRARDQQQRQQPLASAQQRRLSVSSQIQQQQQRPPQMTIGPLIDLAFEIYADMRNVWPIRHLPRLSALAPSTPVLKTPLTSQASATTANGSIGSSMSIFFQLSNRTPTSTSSAVDLSACGVAAPSNGVSTATSANTIATIGGISAVSNIGFPSSSTTSTPLSCVLQELNPTLQANIQVRRLPSKLYLALLHLCIQVPLSGVSVSSQVVKTIVADMISTKPGQQPANLDRHLAAALQYYHDQWMCLTQELKGRRRCHSSGQRDAEPGFDGCFGELEERETNTEEEPEEEEKEEVEKGECIFRRWMYRSEEYVFKHMAASSSSASSSSNSLADNTATSAVPIDADEILSPTLEDRDSPFEVSKYDADLDELDRYLDAKKADDSSSNGHSNNRRRGSNSSEACAGAKNSWMDGLDHDTCSGRFYWDMWSREDLVLQGIRFSRRRARMLWRHVGSL
ncbi:hypothetical protein BGX33_003596 [Mortierella sp. NVP41]|nr:hypothetical protein BGX33_003596 [Mortierella sp. NVP41]